MRTALITLLLFGLGLACYLRFAPEPAPPAPAPKAAVPEPAARPAPRPAPLPPSPVKITRDPNLSPEMKQQLRAFGEETRRMAESLAQGDREKLGRAIRAGMLKPEGQQIVREAQELGQAWRGATEEERVALLAAGSALRDRAMFMLRAELATLDAAPPAAAPTEDKPAAPAM